MAIGSSAEAGSSSSRTSGSIAIARAMQSRCCWPPERPRALSLSRSLTSSQSAAPRSAFSTRSSRPRSQAEVARRPGDVVVDRLREGVRFLEDHPDPPPHLDPVDVAAVDVVAVVEDLALDPEARHRVVHPVEAAQEGRLAAAGGADQGGDPGCARIRRMTPVERLLGAVEDGDVAGVEDHLGRPRPLPLTAGPGWRAGGASGSAPARGARARIPAAVGSRGAHAASFRSAAGQQRPGAEAGEEDEGDEDKRQSPGFGEACGVGFLGELEDPSPGCWAALRTG